MNLLITGGCGFIGAHLAEYYISSGHNVCVIDDLSAGTVDNIQTIAHDPNFKLITADLCDYEDLDAVVKWSDCVLHFAAILGMYKVLSDPLKVLTANTTSTERLLDSISRAKKEIRTCVASTSMVYGDLEATSSSETDLLALTSVYNGATTYTISKIVDEAYTMLMAQRYNIPATILRLFNVVGPRQSGQYGMVVPRFIEQACTGKDITVFGNGEQTRSFCDVRDAVAAIEALRICRSSIGEIVNIGSDQEISINNLALLIKNLTKSTSTITHTPYATVYGEGFTDIMRRQPNLQKLRHLTGFKQSWQLDDTIKSIIL